MKKPYEMTEEEVEAMRKLVQDGGSVPGDVILRALDTIDALRRPVPALISCPRCYEPHEDHLEADGTDWRKRLHRTHLCHNCELTWRPFPIPTTGVLPTLPQAVQLFTMLDAGLTRLATECYDTRRPKLRELAGRASSLAAMTKTLLPSEPRKPDYAQIAMERNALFWMMRDDWTAELVQQEMETKRRARECGCGGLCDSGLPCPMPKQGG